MSYTFPPSVTCLLLGFGKSFFKPQAQTVVEDQIVVIDKFFPHAVCNDLIRSIEGSPVLRLETTPLVKRKGYAVRVNDRCATTDFAATQLLWDYLRQVLLQDLGYEDEDASRIRATFESAKFLNPQLRMYRYRRGHHFGKHYDESVVCPLGAGARAQTGTTRWTLLIYLTGGDEFAGGGTIFHGAQRQPLNIHPTKGMALLHKHGADCLMHEAELVTRGEKWVLRSDVVF